MDTPTVNNTYPPAASAAAAANPAAGATDPFLAILDAAAATHDAADDLVGDDDVVNDEADATEVEREEDEGAEQPDGVTVAAATNPNPLVAAAAGEQARAATKTATAGDRGAPTAPAAPGRADTGTAQANAATPGTKTAVATNAGADRSTAAANQQRPADPNTPRQNPEFRATYDGVRAQPATANAAAAATVAQDGEAVAPDLRAERYAALRAGQGQQAGDPVRMADLGGKATDPNTAGQAQAAAGRAAAATAPTDTAAPRHAAASPAELPVPPTPPTPATPAPALISTAPFGPGMVPATPGQANFAVAGDVAGVVGSLTGTGATGNADTAHVAAATRGQPAVTAKPAEQIAVQIKNGIKSGADKIHIRLQPAALGRVEVNLEVGHDQRVQAVVTVEKAETLEILERDARSLHRMLEEAGFRTDNDSLAFRHQSQDGENPGPGNNPTLAADSEGSADVTPDGDAPERISRHDGLIDVEV